MVSTNSLNGDLDFTINEMKKSELPEDRQLASEAIKMIEDLVKALLPVIVYVDKALGGGFTGIEVSERSNKTKLILTRSGDGIRWSKVV